MNRILTSKWAKVVVFALCLIPLGIIVWEGFAGGWSANPTQFLEHATGDWILRFLAITLAVTPLRKIKILGMTQLIRFRRMLGLSLSSTPSFTSAFISDSTRCWIFTVFGRT